MKYRIELHRNWRPSRRAFFTPGVYRVPEDMSESLAEMAMSERAAAKVEVSKPAATFLGKAISTAPENKSKVDDMRSSGNGAVSDAGSGRSSFRTYRPRGK